MHILMELIHLISGAAVSNLRDYEVVRSEEFSGEVLDVLVLERRGRHPPELAEVRRAPAEHQRDLGLEHLAVLPAPGVGLAQARLDLLLRLAVEPGAVAEQLEHHAHLPTVFTAAASAAAPEAQAPASPPVPMKESTVRDEHLREDHEAMELESWFTLRTT
jgi:ribosomal protein L12E/L44/L45/RPP1/RPP2